jgi:hypothetical protein
VKGEKHTRKSHSNLFIYLFINKISKQLVQKSANGREKTHTWDGVEMLVIGLGCR